jgi:hypothetical protein
MTTYFLRATGGSDSNDGLSYATAFATGNHFETIAAAGDSIICAPGTYRQTWTTAAAGSSGNPITAIGDEGGTLTDGVGGRIRFTGSDNDQTATRTNGIVIASAFRTFTGIHVDGTTAVGIVITAASAIVEACVVSHCGTHGIQFNGTGALNGVIRRVKVAFCAGSGVMFTHTASVSNTGNTVENFYCCSNSAGGAGISIARFGGITVRNVLLCGNQFGVRVTNSPAVGQVNTLNNSVIVSNTTGLSAQATTDLTMDYCNVFGNTTARANVTAGANDQAYLPLFVMPLLTLGVTALIEGDLASYSPLAAIAGTSVPSGDLYGTTRAAPSSWGAVQFEAGRKPDNVDVFPSPRGIR